MYAYGNSTHDRFSMRYLDLSILPLKYHPRLQTLAVINFVKFSFVLTFPEQKKIREFIKKKIILLNLIRIYVLPCLLCCAYDMFLFALT